MLSYLRDSGAVSVNSVSKATGLSKMTVHKIIDHYMQDGMVVLAGKGESTEEGGKKPNLFAFNPNCRYVFGVRLSDHYLSTAVVNLRGDMIVQREWVEISDRNFDEVLDVLRLAFESQIALGELLPDNCLAVVVGMNGVVDSASGICLICHQHPDWGENIPIRDRLSQTLPGAIPVYVDNWWRHLALCEISTDGMSKKENFFFLGNFGDRISGGMVVGGKVFHGAAGFAGEVGHLIVAPGSGVSCVCGGIGCLEAMVAPSRLIELARSWMDGLERGPEPAGRVGDDTPITRLASAAERGNVKAGEIIDEAARHFAVAINNIVQVCDPGHIVLFGEYARLGDKFIDTVREKVESLTLRGVGKKTRIDRSSLDEEAGVVGAANHVADMFFSDDTDE